MRARMSTRWRLALKDNIKFVKLPEKYTDEQLAKARAMCRNTPEVGGMEQ